ncbi:MAG: hypothetical protein MSC50_06045 [Campylobacter sp.]|uniref:hypothetical protein n=2 Tax=Campylobacter sp. TaxID=205 RepID=UPI002AA6B8BC|nr:hypothetical protein [Campylobacter sp.]MCI6579817.1 hypothetical protein [Campylobacter sp.]MCI7014329.1 hypothetical protein [Campylobacter sp.]
MKNTLNNTVTKPKVYIGFLAFLIVIKLIYLYFESIYNIDMLEYSTSPIKEENIDLLRDLEKRGHLISAVGLTLFFSYFIYWSTRKIGANAKKSFITTIVLCLSLCFGFYKGLEALMDEIIAANSDKRYHAYYTNLLKYGIASNRFAYSSYINQDDNITNKVLLSNIYLLNYVDKEVIDKVKEQGKEHLLDWFLDNDGKNEYEASKEKYEATANDIKSAWQEYNSFKTDINKKMEDLPDTRAIFDEIQEGLKDKYAKYNEAFVQYDEYLKKQLHNKQNYYDRLEQYFRYERTKTANEKYNSTVQNIFGSYIEPIEWCEGNFCPTMNRVEIVIRKDALEKLKKQVGDMPRGMGMIEFSNQTRVREQVIAELRSKDIQVSDNLKYTNYDEFKKTLGLNESLSEEHQKAIKEFRVKFAQKTGIENISLNIKDFKSFAMLFKDKAIEKMGSEDFGNEVIIKIANQDLSDFKKMYAKQTLSQKESEIFLEEKDFAPDSNNQKAKQWGDDALKMLYIPPFAIALSLTTGFTNLFCVILNIISLPFFSSNSKMAVIIRSSWLKIVGIGALIVLTLAISALKGYKNKAIALDKINLENESPVVKFIVPLNLGALNSIVFLEKLNYKIQQNTR